MPGTISNAPTVALSFANNFWGKDDAGVEPLLLRMHNAKQTCDELKSFYSSRAAIEDEYARKLLSLSRKSLGSQESGTLRVSLDVVKGEVEQMGKSHQNIASQIKTELEEPLAAFSGAMKERRKIVQSGIEKLHKVKLQQTNQVNKTRDRYEQECLKIKGYLAQGHMVMGQEERKNKAKLEKTQIHLAASNTEYENAIKALEDTTGRWNRDWKAAADKFQDLEEERLDFTKSSLWSFANIASTVCVSDDASCEKIRLSLEKCEVEKDIAAFIKECGTGQEIPDPPKYINFCRGDASDSQSELSEEDQYSVAQFQRTINPAYRSSSPQPSTYESHHGSAQINLTPDANDEVTSPFAKENDNSQKIRNNQYKKSHIDNQLNPRKSLIDAQSRLPMDRQNFEQNLQNARGLQVGRQRMEPDAQSDRHQPRERQPLEHGTSFYMQSQSEQPIHNSSQHSTQENQNLLNSPMYRKPQNSLQESNGSQISYDPFPMDGMTMLCRTGPSLEKSQGNSSGPSLERSPAHSSGPPSEKSPARSSGASSFCRDIQSDLTSLSSHEAISSKTTPIKQSSPSSESPVFKKKGGFFQNHGPFRRKSNKGYNNSRTMTPSNRNTWSSRSRANTNDTSLKDQIFSQSTKSQENNRLSRSPDTINPIANLQLNVGNNIFDVETPKQSSRAIQSPEVRKDEELDPIVQALAELKGVTKASSTRVSADKYHGITTPAPRATPLRNAASQQSNGAITAAQRGTPPPSYDLPVQRLGPPQPAFTSKAMQYTKQKYTTQTQNMFKAQGSPEPRAVREPSTNYRSNTRGREIPRALSPTVPREPSPRQEIKPETRHSYRSVSPNSYSEPQQNHQYTRQKTRSSDQVSYMQNSPSRMRVASPAVFRESDRPSSRNFGNEQQMQLALADDEYYAPYGGGRNSRGSGSMSPRPLSRYEGGGVQDLTNRQRSRSVADVRQYNSQGRPILHFARALYMYQAAIPEELSFAKGDVLAVLRHQDDGWWEAEIAGRNERPGLVPSNYVQNC
ncbi:putative contractile ring protein imp2 [Erysiphe necator]|uniref:Putative contractile ring protein imp2 n=1 Tax=Uncinula necator TaxID=52586 RepID=A0A0B1P6P6_UNCNE|nr:putative contractile ring protein imp2 [Erysiphe necator]